MDFLNFTLTRLLIGGAMVGGLSSLLVSLIVQKTKYYNLRITKSILSNSGSYSEEQITSFYKPKKFLQMVNAGENLCADDINFDFFDYCGDSARMFYNNGGEKNETSN